MDDFLAEYTLADIKNALNTLRSHTTYFCPVADLDALEMAISALEVMKEQKEKE